jgi:hypothetical protein
VNGHLEYPKNLAKSVGREDLEIVSPYWLESDAHRGRRMTGLIIDHAVHLTTRQFDGLELAMRGVVSA